MYLWILRKSSAPASLCPGLRGASDLLLWTASTACPCSSGHVPG